MLPGGGCNPSRNGITSGHFLNTEIIISRTAAANSAITIALSYVVGGLIPLFPYMTGNSLPSALAASVTITLLALLLFGGIKGRLTGAGTLRSGIQTVLIGGLAAGAAYALAHLLSAH